MLFKELGLTDPLQRALQDLKYTEATPIQGKSIGELLAGKDLVGIAQTGTGKTAAFALPILQKLTPLKSRDARVLVLAPTRELAAQIGVSFRSYGKYLKFRTAVIFGGVSQVPQVKLLRQGVDIVVATPGRLLDLMNQGKLNLRHVEYFVLDEADRMLDMGFIHDIKKIIGKLPTKRQSIFFSATMPKAVSSLASQLLQNPVRVEVAPQSTTAERVSQHVFFVGSGSKEKLLLELLLQKHLTRVLVFTRTKHRANKVAKYLCEKGVASLAIHGNKSQGARQKALDNFKRGVVKVLVATDIAARGIDVTDISHVINFDLPREPESYVHRIGRTARAGAAGIAYSFCSAEERGILRDIEKLIRAKLEVMEHTYHSVDAQNGVGVKVKKNHHRRRKKTRRGFSRLNRS